MKEKIFLTGFPGFIGRRIVARILKETESELFLLIQSQMRGLAEKVLSDLDPQRERTVLLEGDIIQPNLGLTRNKWELLVEEVNNIYHLAALYHLGAGWRLSYQVNVLGTRHIIYLAQRARHFRRFNYFSTAYVAGKRRGVVYEEDLDCGQRFRNYYEGTKFQAEVEVRKHMGEIPTTIYRPAIVVGDSETGATDKYDGPYYVIQKLVWLENRGKVNLAPFFVPPIGPGETELNVVPVDFIVDAVMALDQKEEAEGLTFHLVDPQPLMVKEFRNYVFDQFGAPEAPFYIPKGVLKLFPFIPQLLWDKLVGIPLQALYYMNDTPHYDTSQAEKFLNQEGITCPGALTYLDHMIDFVRQNPEGSPGLVSTPEGVKPAREK